MQVFNEDRSIESPTLYQYFSPVTVGLMVHYLFAYQLILMAPCSPILACCCSEILVFFGARITWWFSVVVVLVNCSIRLRIFDSEPLKAFSLDHMSYTQCPVLKCAEVMYGLFIYLSIQNIYSHFILLISQYTFPSPIRLRKTTESCINVDGIHNI